jgi:hypothetical protein
MQVFLIFKHSEKGFRAVKRGFSWPGFFFTWIWALSRQLWLEAGLLMLFSGAIAALVLELDLGTGSANRYYSLAVALFYMGFIGFKGNSWRSRNLEARGFLLLGAIKARDPQDAQAKAATVGTHIPEELKADFRQSGLFSVPRSLQALFAIIALTWKAAFRYRLFWVIMTLLLGAVVGLPLLLKHDGTAEGFAQVLITYTLGAVTALLGLCTLWLACGTLARDVEECQIQMLVVKPVPRWQIWLGKWLGLVLLNAALLAIVGVSLYGLLQIRSRNLSQEELFKLRTQVLVARASARETGSDKIIADETRRRLDEQLAKKTATVDAATLEKRIADQVKAELQSVSPAQGRRWIIHLGRTRESLKGEPLYLRIKFNAADSTRTKTYAAMWRVGDPAGKQPAWATSEPMSLTADAFHDFPIPSEVVGDNGDLEIVYANENQVAILFPLNDGMEVLYREGGFALNLVRGLGIILCWMALFAALGLAAASFLSFPVAAFCSLAMLGLGLSSGTISNVVTEGTVFGVDENGVVRSNFLDNLIIPLFDGMLKIINLVGQYSPVEALSTGRSVPWSQLGLAAAQIVLLLGGLLALFGMFVFNRRELATAQGTN